MVQTRPIIRKAPTKTLLCSYEMPEYQRSLTAFYVEVFYRSARDRVSWKEMCLEVFDGAGPIQSQQLGGHIHSQVQCIWLWSAVICNEESFSECANGGPMSSAGCAPQTSSKANLCPQCTSASIRLIISAA